MGQNPLIQSPRISIHTTQVCEEINTNTSNINCGVVADFNFLPYLHPFLLFSLLNNRKIMCCFVDFNRKSNTELLFWRMLEGGHSQGDEGGLGGDVSPVRVELKDTVLGSLDRRKDISRMRICSPYSRWLQHASYEHRCWTFNTFNVNDT